MRVKNTQKHPNLLFSYQNPISTHEALQHRKKKNRKTKTKTKGKVVSKDGQADDHFSQVSGGFFWCFFGVFLTPIVPDKNRTSSGM